MFVNKKSSRSVNSIGEPGDRERVLFVGIRGVLGKGSMIELVDSDRCFAIKIFIDEKSKTQSFMEMRQLFLY